MILGAVLRRLWPLFLGALAVVVLVHTGRRNGALAARLEAATRNTQTQERMRDAVAHTRTDRGSVVDRLRRGEF